jgi:hypothetical protein
MLAKINRRNQPTLPRSVTSASVRVDQLTPSLLAKAFRGDLVPQDPSDEPASVLLERIRASRAAAPSRPQRGRSGARLGGANEHHRDSPASGAS